MLALIAVLVAGVLVSTGAFTDPPKAFCPDEYDSDDVANLSQLDDRAEPLAPAGPRPMLIFEVHNEEPLLARADTPEDGEATDITRESGSLPDSWYAKDKVQLLVCQYRHHVGDGPSDQCAGIPVLAATYTYKIYAAGTKDLLGTFDIKGDKKSCFGIIVSRKGAEPREVFEPDMPEVFNRLRQYAEPASTPA